MVALVRPVKWCAIPLSEVRERKFRLEAGVHGVEARTVRNHLIMRSGGSVPLMGNAFSPVTAAYYGSRGKRNYISPMAVNAIGFLGSAEMLSCFPEADKFMEKSGRTADLQVSQEMVLVSRSGTIGNLAFVNQTLSSFLVSEHAIRLVCRQFPGFVYTFLKSRAGQILIKSCVFGSVIQEIEPEHLADIPVPNAPDEVKRRIHEAVVRSYELRDESNELIVQARALLAKALALPPLADFSEVRAQTSEKPQTFSVSLKELAGRLDGSYHLPVVRAIEAHLNDHAAEVTTVGDPRVSQNIILPGRFKRVYVEEGHGRPMIGGKQLGELDPSNKKYLSNSQHKKELDALAAVPGMILVTRSGTIGRVAFVPRHWNGWIPSDHIIRIIPASPGMGGFLYVWLASEWARPLVKRNTFGAVIDEISDAQLAAVSVPLLKDASVQAEINTLVLTASSKRSEAYDLEQTALRIMENEVLPEEAPI